MREGEEGDREGETERETETDREEKRSRERGRDRGHSGVMVTFPPHSKNGLGSSPRGGTV